MGGEPCRWSRDMTRTLKLVVVGMVVLGLVACQSNNASPEPTASPQPAPSSDDPRTADTDDSSTGPLLVRPPLCDTVSHAGDCMAVVETAETASFSAAEYYGELIVSDGCVFMRIDGRAPIQVVVFPNGTSWDDPAQMITLTNGDVVGDGDWVVGLGDLDRPGEVEMDAYYGPALSAAIRRCATENGSDGYVDFPDYLEAATAPLASPALCSRVTDAATGNFDFTDEANVRALIDDPSWTDRQRQLLGPAVADAVRQITSGGSYSNDMLVAAVNEICGAQLTPVTMTP